MKQNELDIQDWKEMADIYKSKHKSLPYGLAMRIDNNQLSIGRYYGMFRLDGHEYVAVNPRETNLRLGSPRRWLGIELEFYKWVGKRPAKVKIAPIDAPKQMEML